MLIHGPGFSERQISTVNAGIATHIRAIPLAVSLPRMLEKIEAELALAGPGGGETSANGPS